MSHDEETAPPTEGRATVRFDVPEAVREMDIEGETLTVDVDLALLDDPTVETVIDAALEILFSAPTFDALQSEDVAAFEEEGNPRVEWEDQDDDEASVESGGEA